LFNYLIKYAIQKYILQVVGKAAKKYLPKKY